MTSPTITALLDQRRDILRDMAILRDEMAECEKAVHHLDAVIHLLDPTVDLAAVTPKKHVTFDEIFRPGEAPLMALDALREANTALSTTDILKVMLEKKGGPRLTPRQFQVLLRKINAGLNGQFRKGLIRKAGRDGGHGANRAVIWHLI
ncbi:MAG: hypothetical protein PW843_08825 [Azospirillaceae bacterium]|nr:hypothetical protein [Azospirillaceae bacterium]